MEFKEKTFYAVTCSGCGQMSVDFDVNEEFTWWASKSQAVAYVIDDLCWSQIQEPVESIKKDAIYCEECSAGFCAYCGSDDRLAEEDWTGDMTCHSCRTKYEEEKPEYEPAEHE